MTPKQKQMLEAIRELSSDGECPSFEELRAHLGLSSKRQVSVLVHGLVDGGWLVCPPNRRRALRLTLRSDLDGLNPQQLLSLRRDIDARLHADLTGAAA